MARQHERDPSARERDSESRRLSRRPRRYPRACLRPSRRGCSLGRGAGARSPDGHVSRAPAGLREGLTLSSSPLVAPLAEFLDGANMGYSEAEVNRWLTELRHPATHADRKASFVLESDVRPVMPRMMQAAYDALFNKESWRSPVTQRRDLWRPPGGTLAQSGELFMAAGSKVKVEHHWFDEAGSYPWNLHTDISRALPPTMWSEWPSEADPH